MMSDEQKPVAWMYTLEYGDTVANKKVSLSQLNYPFGVCGADYLRENSDGMSYVRQTLLYAQPVLVSNQTPVAWMCTETKVLYDNDTSAVDKYHGFNPTVPLYAHPNPAVVKQLVEAAESALEAMLSVAEEAYQRAEPVCCGRGGNECCGCPEPKWNSADEVILLRLHRPQQELTAALAAAKEAGL
jgi:hypothetical protein